MYNIYTKCKSFHLLDSYLLFVHASRLDEEYVKLHKSLEPWENIYFMAGYEQSKCNFYCIKCCLKVRDILLSTDKISNKSLHLALVK